MFRELQREARRLEGINQIPVTIQCDEDGYFDRRCHAAECMFEFKIHLEDWHDKVEGRVFCPFCGHSDDTDNWNTQEQDDYLSEVPLAHVSRRVDRAMRRDADEWNRRQAPGDFVTITMNVDGHPKSVPLPPSASDAMRLRVDCSQCSCRFAVVGAAFFCPGCGHNDAEVLFNHSISGIRMSLNASDEVRAAIADAETAENIVRALSENGLQSAVTAFQRYAEVLFSRCETNTKPRRNAFQNLDVGNKLWYDATGRNYSDYLSAFELAQLKRAFQQRHLLAHTQGIVDQDYITNIGDRRHELGQRIVIREATVHHFLDSIEKLAAGLLEAANATLAQASDTNPMCPMQYE